MSLIEQLGGYEKAKEWYIDQDLRGNHTVKIRNALLQYRRENSIFEVGDSVVLINGYSDDVHYLSGWYIENLDFRYTTKSGEWGVIIKSSMVGIWRHATPQEIEAGRRL